MSSLNYTPNGSDVQAHLRILQDVITRMASNSRFCKAWCIALVSAVLVLVARTDMPPSYALIALFPIGAFSILDTSYLSLERRFRKTYKCLVSKIHTGTIAIHDLYAIHPTGAGMRAFFSSLSSWSIWPFYGMLSGMLVVIWIALHLGGPPCDTPLQ